MQALLRPEIRELQRPQRTPQRGLQHPIQTLQQRRLKTGIDASAAELGSDLRGRVFRVLKADLLKDAVQAIAC